MTDADICRKNNWAVGTRLVGDDGYGEAVIEITAIGEENVLAKAIGHNGESSEGRETLWILSCRKWREATVNYLKGVE